MLEVSQAFTDAIVAPARRTTARVTFDITDITAAEDADVSVTSESIISRAYQLSNRKRDRPKYATFEPGYWRLDGSFVIPPKPEDEGFEVGWYSQELCDENGVFATPQVVDFAFSEPHSSVGLTVDFDLPVGECAEDFDIETYDGNNILLKKVEVRGNTEAHYVADEPFENYSRIRVTIFSWCVSFRRAKVVEVSFGVVRVYDDNNLVNLSLVEELSLTAETVPANELKFTVDNANKEFNILNPEGSYKFLQERQIALLELGVEIAPDEYEYVGMGRYYLTDWQSDEGSLTTTFTARNLIDFLPSAEVESLTPITQSLKDLAEDVLQTIGVKRYILDSVLESIQTAGLYNNVTYRELLQMIAIAGQCVLYVDRDDTLRIERSAEGPSAAMIDFDNTYQEPQIKLDRLVSKVAVNYYSDPETVAGAYVATGSTDGGITLKVENTLINSQNHAQSVAEWLLAESQRRALYEINWRQNPAMECGDLVDVEDSFGANRQNRITAQEFEYAGYLKGKTKTRGVLP